MGLTPSKVKRCIESANQRRAEHRYSWGGWTKNRHMKAYARIPLQLYLQPEFMKRYFPEGTDADKEKALEKLKSDARFRKFITHD